jgi:hypothetical protein
MRGEITDKVLQALGFGPMSVHEIAFETGLTTEQVHRVMLVATSNAVRVGKRAYVKEWVWRKTANPFLSQRLYCAVYALGDKPCAKKPATRTNAERMRVKRQSKKTLAANSSIFNRSNAA